MEYKIEFTEKFKKQIKKMDPYIARYIINWIEANLKGNDPFSIGKHLKGNLKGIYRYRISNYRLLCKIESNVLKIIILEVGKRDTIYN